MELQHGFGVYNQALILTLTPSADISAGVGNVGTAGWTADGAYTFMALAVGEFGTPLDEPLSKEFEMDISINGHKINNYPVSARALGANGLGRRFADFFEGRRFGVLRADRIDVTFYNVDAGAAIRPKLYLIGHRGWPANWRQTLVAASRNIKGDPLPRIIVVRDPADGSVANGATNEGNFEFTDCYSLCRMTFADKVSGTGHPADFDHTLKYSQGAEQTLGAGSGEALRRASLRSICADEGLDLVELNYGIPPLVQSGDSFFWKFFNDTGSTIYPRLIYLGHEGMPLGPPNLFAGMATESPSHPQLSTAPDA